MTIEDYKKKKIEEVKKSLGATRDFEPMFPSSFSGALKTLDENTAKPIRYATNEAVKTGKPWEFFKGLAKAVTEEIPDVSGKEIAGNLGLSTKEYGKTDNEPLRYSGSGISESPFKTSPAGLVGFGLENLLDAENLIPAGKAMAVGGLALGGLKKVGKEVGEGLAKKARNLDAMGFYSEMEDQISNMDFKSIPASDLLNRLRKTVKPDELQYSGMEDYLKNHGGKVSKEDLNQFYEPKLEKTTKSNKPKTYPEGTYLNNETGETYTIDEIEDGRTEWNHDDDPDFDPYENMEDVSGENIPESSDKLEYEDYTTKINNKNPKTESLITYKDNKTQPRYKSSHWDDSNVLAHYRAQEIPDEKNYLIEEIQSDWHQDARKSGYINQKDRAETAKELEKYGFKNPQDVSITMLRESKVPENVIDKFNSSFLNTINHVPEAPYKKNWPLMTFKNALKDAVDGGNEFISWVPGKEQADRFSLSKTISEIQYLGTKLKAYDHQGNEVISRTGVRPEELPELIGKGASEKLLSAEPQGAFRGISGLDLDVGGEGMKGFYDDILPKEVGKYIKKLDPEATVGKKEIKTKKGPLEVWSVKLTDKLKNEVLRGQTRYGLAPIGPWMLYQQQKGDE